MFNILVIIFIEETLFAFSIATLQTLK